MIYSVPYAVDRRQLYKGGIGGIPEGPDLDKTCVDDINDAVDGDGRLGDVGAHHHLAARSRLVQGTP